MYTLYGDGIHDDTPALQELLDTRAAEISLPAPAVFYSICRTLKIHSGQTLRLAPTARIRLAAASNCSMIENDDFSRWTENITVDGGIWDFNNTEQEPNPFHFPGKDGRKFYAKLGMTDEYKNDFDFREKVFHTYTQFPDIYTGFAMRFCRVKGLTLKNITYRNPVTYAVQLGYTENFTVRDIVFDYTTCNPKWWNMDGIHVDGHCKNGFVNNLKGTCHDDLVAITADDGLYGPIENIVVDGLFAEHCHSAVRLLSWGIPIRNITIRNIFGSYYAYTVGITKYYGDETTRGVMENITIDGVAACFCEGTVDVAGGNHPFIWVQSGLDVDGLAIRNVFREERTYPAPFFQLDKGARVSRLVLDNLVQKSHLDVPVPFLKLDGEAEDVVQGYTRNLQV